MRTPEERLREVRVTLLVLAEVIEKVKDKDEKDKLVKILSRLKSAVA